VKRWQEAVCDGDRDHAVSWRLVSEVALRDAVPRSEDREAVWMIEGFLV